MERSVLKRIKFIQDLDLRNKNVFYFFLSMPSLEVLNNEMNVLCTQNQVHFVCVLIFVFFNQTITTRPFF